MKIQTLKLVGSLTAVTVVATTPVVVNHLNKKEKTKIMKKENEEQQHKEVEIEPKETNSNSSAKHKEDKLKKTEKGKDSSAKTKPISSVPKKQERLREITPTKDGLKEVIYDITKNENGDIINKTKNVSKEIKQKVLDPIRDAKIKEITKKIPKVEEKKDEKILITKYVDELGNSIKDEVKNKFEDKKEIENYLYVNTIDQGDTRIHVYKKIEPTVILKTTDGEILEKTINKNLVPPKIYKDKYVLKNTIKEVNNKITHIYERITSSKVEALVQPENPTAVVSEKGEPLIQPENPVGVVSEKGEPLVQPEKPVGVVSEKGQPLVQPENPTAVVSKKGEALIQPEKPVGVVSEKGEPLVQPEKPTAVVSEKGEPLVQPEKPIGVVSEKGEPLVQPENPTAVVSEKGEPLVQPEKPIGAVSEKGEPLVQPEKPTAVVSEKGEPLVQTEKPIGVVFEKGEPLVQPENPTAVVSEKGEPLVQSEKPIGAVSEKGEPLVQPENPTAIVSEKGEPLVQPENPTAVVSEKGEPLVQPENEELVLYETGESLIQPELKALKITAFVSKEDNKLLDFSEGYTDKKDLSNYEYVNSTKDEKNNIQTHYYAPKEIEETLTEPFEIEYVEDNSIPKNTEVIKKEGELGITKVYSKIINGKKTILRKEVVKSPVKQIVHRGTNVLETKNVKEKEKIHFNKLTVEDNNQYTDYLNTVPGVEGEKEITYKVTTNKETGVVVSKEKISENTLKEKKDEITYKGTKPLTRTEEVSKKENIPFNIINKTNNEMFEDETTETKGEEGVVNKTYERTISNKTGEEISLKLIKEKTERKPVDKVITRGTKPLTIEKIEKETITEKLPPVYVEDSKLAEGKTEIANQGKDNITEITYKTIINNKTGTEISKVKTNTVVKQKGEPKVIKKGTKKNQTITRETTEEVIHYTSSVIEDNTKFTDFRNVEVKGVNGKIVNVYTVTKEGDKVVSRAKETTTETPAVNEVIRQGTRPIIVKKEVKEKEGVPFEIEYVKDPNRLTGEDYIEVYGEEGLEEVTYKVEVNEKENKEIKKEVKSRTRLIAPKKQIVKKGTKPLIRTVEETKDVESNFRTDIILDNTKFTDYIKTEQGEKGLTREYYSVTYSNRDNSVISKEFRRSEIIRPTKNTKITRGTKPLTTEEIVKEVKTIPFSTTTTVNNNKFVDEVLETPGVDGKEEITYKVIKDSKTGQIKEKIKQGTRVLQRSIPHNTERGTKQLFTVKTVKEKEVANYNIINNVSNDLFEGETHETPGVNGEKNVTYTVKVNNRTNQVVEKIKTKEEIIKPAKDKVIVHGKKPLMIEKTIKETVSSTLPEVLENSVRHLKGTQHTLQENVNKIVENTYKIITNQKTGKEVSKTLSNSKVLNPGKPKIVEVGTAETIEYNEELVKTKEPGVEYIDMPEWDDDREEIVTQGHPGEIREEYKVTKHWQRGIISKRLVSSTTVKEFKQKVVKRGTKASGRTYNTIMSTITPYVIERIYDNNLPLGETKIEKQGKAGTEKQTFRIVKDRNGKTKSRTLINVEHLTKPINQVVRIGTKVEHDLILEKESVRYETITRVNKNLQPNEERVIQNGEEGEDSVFYKYDRTNPGIVYKIEKQREHTKPPKPKIIETGVNGKHKIFRPDLWNRLHGESKKFVDKIPDSFEDIKKLSEEEIYNRAKTPNTGWYQYNKETVDYLNSQFNQDKFNEYFLEILNKERAAAGLSKMTYNKDLLPFAKTRAEELAPFGDIRVNGKPHVRADERPWDSVLDGSKFDGTPVGENLAGNNLTNPYTYVSEKYFAEQFFKQWKSSPSHYENMMDPRNVSHAVGIKFSYDSYNRINQNFYGINGVIGAELLEKKFN